VDGREEVSMLDVERAWVEFRKTVFKYVEYLEWLETQQADRLTYREREALKKHGNNKS
jgi:hypothetical protein